MHTLCVLFVFVAVKLQLNLHMSLMVNSLLPGPSGSEATLNDMCKCDTWVCTHR